MAVVVIAYTTIAVSVWSRPVQVLAVVVVSISLVVVALLLARRSLMSMRYALGWIFVAVCIAIGGLFGGLVTPVADVLDIHSTVLIVGVAAGGFLALTVQLSISVSGLTETNRALAESIAILQARIEALETKRVDGNEVGEC